MKKRYVDPFSPDLPINDPDRFSGRYREVDSIVDSLYQLSNKNPVHTIITGDRGIGKSSLLIQVKNLAEGNGKLSNKLKINLGVESYDYICAWHDCASDQTPADLASGILSKLQNKFFTLWNKLNFELDIAGFLKIFQKENKSASATQIVELFCNELTKACKKAQEQGKTGVILFVDELDRVDPTSGIATFFKLSAERLSREGITNVAFFTAGITGAIQNLEQEHGSIYRTFKDVPLPKLEEAEVHEILVNGFNKAGFLYERTVIRSIFKISAGYPEPVHLLGSQLLKVSENTHLTDEDFNTAKRQVVESLRRNKLASMLKNAGSGKYQKILEAMAQHTTQNVPLSFISENIGYEQNQYSANMGRLVKRNIISQVDRGIYCFVDPLLKEYIARFGIIDVDEDETI
jgi:hypothetical protein